MLIKIVNRSTCYFDKFTYKMFNIIALLCGQKTSSNETGSFQVLLLKF